MKRYISSHKTLQPPTNDMILKNNDTIEIHGQFMSINNKLWNIQHIRDITLSDDKKEILVHGNNGINIIKISEDTDMDTLYKDICKKFSQTKRLK